MPNKFIPATAVCPAHTVHFDSLLPKLLGTTAITPRPGHIYVRGNFLSKHLHAHEGGHIVQWATLGVRKFVLQYGTSLVKGHDNRPLEIDAERFAVEHEADFEEVWK